MKNKKTEILTPRAYISIAVEEHQTGTQRLSFECPFTSNLPWVFTNFFSYEYTKLRTKWYDI